MAHRPFSLKNLFLLFILAGILSVQCQDNKSRKRVDSGHSFSFGVVTDIQYADKEAANGREYRTSLINLKKCVSALNLKYPAFTIQLGDLADGQKEISSTRNDLDSVLFALGQLRMPLYHALGNHDLAAGKDYLHKLLKLPKFYYDFTSPSADGWHFIVLDGNDGGYGVMGEEQLGWLKETLSKTRKNKEKVICFCHFALLREAANKHHMANPGPILKLIENSGCVAAWFAGHDHQGGYSFHNGIHHVTFRGMVEAPEKNSYAVVEVDQKRIRINGTGEEPDRNLKIK